MYKLFKKQQRAIFLCSIFFAIGASGVFGQSSIRLNVDATDAAKNLLHTKETLAVKPGPLTLYYPKWIPGEHSPTGPLNNIINLFISANGKRLEWRRDDVDMFAFHVVVPAGVKTLDITFDDASQSGTTMSAELARIKWNRLLLYPLPAKSDTLQVTGSIKMPVGWKYATALAVDKESGDTVDFKPATLTYFIDSPAVIGRYFKKVPLLTVDGAAHEMDIFADNAAALEYKPETLEGWNNLIKEANLLFGAHHYKNYKFLLTLSDVGGSEGLEHNESSEDGTGEKALSNEAQLLDLGDLLGHEYAHSWNGKYRRPAGLATGDFHTPMKGELLWVYEGLTEYLGRVLPTRSKLWTPEFFREVIASDTAELDHQTGRRWRPVVDTARDVQDTYSSPRMWRNQRRRVEYYDEGAMVWLDADVLIRQKSAGKLSLDDFMKKFHGAPTTGARVVPYDLEEVIRTLNAVVPYDWRGFLNQRIYKVQDRVTVGGIVNGGWTLIYNDTPNAYSAGREEMSGSTDFGYSIGILVNDTGAIADINPDLAAAKAGLAPGMKIIKVNGNKFSVENLHKAVAATKAGASAITIEADNNGEKATYTLNYRGGERYPHLVRDETKPDLLSGVIKSH